MNFNSVGNQKMQNQHNLAQFIFVFNDQHLRVRFGAVWFVLIVCENAKKVRVNRKLER